MPSLTKDESLSETLQRRGVSRRDFLKFCAVMAGALAMPTGAQTQIAQALETKRRTPVIWLEMQDCAGCSEAFLRASRPTAAEVVLDVLSIDYHETIMAAAGNLAEEAKQATIKAGGYLLVVEGSLSLKDAGIYCCVGGKDNLTLLKEAAGSAVAVIAVGNCAAFGGIPRAKPNPTDAVGVMDLVTDKPVLNLPGCPYNVDNLTATVVHYLTFGQLPAMDKLHRPLFAYGHLIHDNCERRGHFAAGEFVKAWGDDGHRAGWCLYQMGCKGPSTYNNCPTLRFNEGTSWPVGSGHGCIGCAEPGFWDTAFYTPVHLQEFTPPTTYAPVQTPSQKIDPTAAGIIGGVTGLALGAVSVAAYQALSRPDTAQKGPAAAPEPPPEKKA